MAESTAAVTWLTQEAFDRLTARKEVTDKIQAAREEGDLKENGGYHAAKEEQGKMETRIRQLRQLLENAQVGEAPADNGIINPGMVVTIKYAGDDDTMTFLLGSREDHGGTLEAYSPNSPLGAALIGKLVGTSAVYSLPNGNKVSVDIIDAKPYTG
jgi:transcription elongation factor GreA